MCINIFHVKKNIILFVGRAESVSVNNSSQDSHYREKKIPTLLVPIPPRTPTLTHGVLGPENIIFSCSKECKGSCAAKLLSKLHRNEMKSRAVLAADLLFFCSWTGSKSRITLNMKWPSFPVEQKKGGDCCSWCGNVFAYVGHQVLKMIGRCTSCYKHSNHQLFLL